MLVSRRALALVLLAAVALACGDEDTRADGTQADDAATTTTTVATTTTDEPTTTTEQTDPPTVVVAGDSIIYDVSPVLVAALDPDAARVIPLVAPALSAESNRVSLLATAEESDADVVVVMVGIWERVHTTADGSRIGDPNWETSYAAEVLDPVADGVTAAGGRLVLLGPPHIRVAADDAQIAELERIWSAYADTHPDVTFVDSDEWLLDADEFVELDGDVRIRRLDGIHLCEEGARRIAAGIIDAIGPELDAAGTAPAPGWETATWTERFPADECPPTA